TVAVKQITLLVAFVGFFLVVVSVVRPSEVRAFGALFVGLACVTALGTLYQYRAGTNLFFQWTDAILPGNFRVLPPPLAAHAYDRQNISGPTQHGLAVTTMLVLAL